MIRYLTLLYLTFLCASHPIIGQNIELRVGLEAVSEFYFQYNKQDSPNFFQRASSVDAKRALGARLDIIHQRVGIGFGLSYNTFGFRKQNKDSIPLISLLNKSGIYLYERINYKAHYVEVPLRIFYKLSPHPESATVGFTYSFHFLMSSSVTTSIYDHNIRPLSPSLNPITSQEAFQNGAIERVHTFSPYLEAPLFTNDRFSVLSKVGFRILGKPYHRLVDNRPISLFWGFVGTYFLN